MDMPEGADPGEGSNGGRRFNGFWKNRRKRVYYSPLSCLETAPQTLEPMELLTVPEPVCLNPYRHCLEICLLLLKVHEGSTWFKKALRITLSRVTIG